MPLTPAKQPEPFVTVEEVAEILGVSTNFVYEKSAAGVIPCWKFGRYNRYRISEVIAALTVEADKELAEDG